MVQGENPIDLLRGELKKFGIEIDIEWNADLQRNNSQWFVGKKWDFDGVTYYRCWFGDYKRDIREEWKSYGKLDKKQADAAEIQSNDLLAKEKEAREKLQLEAAVDCQREWETFASTGTTPYMQRKLIKDLYGARIKANEPNDPIVVVPLRDLDGTLWNFQRIYAQKLSKGDKFFADGAKIEGLFHVLDWSETRKPSPGSKIFICEGFATAASCYEALGNTSFVVAAFNAGNLQAVATEFRARYPSSEIVILGDNDAYTSIKKGGVETLYNVGIEKGRRAAGAVGGTIVYPIFKYPAKGLTDFNDLHAAEGIDRVRDQIEHFENYVKGIQPMCLPVTKSGKIKEPTEKEVCDYLLKWFDDKIVRQERSLFSYTGTHWIELKTEGVDRIKQMIQVAANGLLGARSLENYFKYFFIHSPTVPGGVDLYQPNPFAANFQNGTLHAWRQGDKFVTEFRKHEKSDYLISVLPFDKPDWKPGQSLPPAPVFDQMIENLWALNADKKQVHELAHELIGAALMPTFPIIVIYHGKPNSGKSTFIKLIVKLVQKENVCSVQLCDMHSFNMESMIGKLVNFDTDIDVNKPINDSEVKKLIDRVPRRVKRKGIADVYAHLPALHLFAANRPPKSLDGSSHAYGRRMILVKTDSLVVPEKRVLDFEQRLLDTEMEGIVARGLQGLFRLMESEGLYTIPESSSEQVRNLEMESDLLGQFIEDVEHGEVRTEKAHLLIINETARIDRPVLWETFKTWQENTTTKNFQIGKHEFMEKIERRGFEFKRDKDGRYYRGIGLQVQKEPIA